MKKIALIVYILLFTCSLFALPDSQSVSIILATKVPGFLKHGFLEQPSDADFTEEVLVEDAFSPAGAVLNYRIVTNTLIPLVVQATISPFLQQGVLDPFEIDVSQIVVDGSLAIQEDEKYPLVKFTPEPGKILYPHTLTVFADQNKVLDAPVGEYQSTVEIAISVGD